MILKKDFDINLAKFGIHIPLGERIAIILEHLTSNYSDNIYYPKEFKDVGFTQDDLLLAHNYKYVESLWGHNLDQVMKICYELEEYGDGPPCLDFGQLRDLILREGFYTYQGMKLALKNGFCYFLGGGMHHAMSFSGRGFCLINDVVIGARKLMGENLIKTVWVLDIDAHKGDGTSEICHQDTRFITLSIHMKNGWPFSGKNNCDPEMIPSNVDIPMDLHEENLYLERLAQGLNELKQISNTRPDLAIVVDGADPYIDDKLPGSAGIRLDKKQMLSRDQLVYHFLLGNKIPMLYVMGGGYGKQVGQIYIQFLDWLLKQRSDE